ncbi:sulfite exporter TauE/SafE family protein [Arthrobacter antibioticus]|uniref:sulfite exporter TauE/SafE family protein n=1 Tax=Arthrobacter sp. H35-MC1 TaxID=3046203 RepID=UPI0024B9D1F6|nr:sulfite exporter TauE/SafE family protein [Arthrobacter sp. H35-MC1]MDJ0317479.1 sulfite exporter TauE/SafE family protein [Arthrobacter sp. H35-MC1]
MFEMSAIFLAGFWAGMINIVVGSGTLVTFPVLLLFGYPPIVANISNNIGLVAGGLSGVWGYRKELAPNKELITLLLPASAVGGLAGALLLFILPPSAFNTVVPTLIIAGILMVAFGPSLQRRVAQRQRVATNDQPGRKPIVLIVGVFVLGMYGGYFGAAQGILIVGLMGILTTVALQQINAVKNVLTTAVNGIAAIIFMVVAWQLINWQITALIAAGSLLGGMMGARFGRKLPPMALRATIVLVGLVALTKLLIFP